MKGQHFEQMPKLDRLIERSCIVFGVCAGHILLASLLCGSYTKPSPLKGEEGQVALVSLFEAMPQNKPSLSPTFAKPQLKPAELPPQPAPEQANEAEQDPQLSESAEPQLSDAESDAVAQFNLASQGEPDAPCDLTSTLRTALTQSPEVQLGLTELPKSKRSVANAIMLWDGQWSAESLSGGHGLLRALLVKAITSARPECLQQANTGPVLFLVPDHQTMVVLAIGSGEWHWGDLLPARDTTVPLIAANNYF